MKTRLNGVLSLVYTYIYNSPEMPRTKFCNETLTCARSTEANLKIRDTTRPPSNVLILFSLLASFPLPLPSCNESLPFGKGKVYLSRDELRGG